MPDSAPASDSKAAKSTLPVSVGDFQKMIPKNLDTKKYLLEGAGTAALTLVVIFSVAGGLGIFTAFTAGITIAALVYGLGKITGAHINPAVTAGLLINKKIAPIEGGLYIGAQVAGAILAAMVALIIGVDFYIASSNNLTVLLGEALGGACLGFAVGLVGQRDDYRTSGALVGIGLFCGILLAASFSNAVLNPAVALGIGSFSWWYLFGPIGGIWAGMWASQRWGGLVSQKIDQLLKGGKAKS